MKPLKPVILKTYGKQSRKLSLWISPQDRKRAFESSLSTDGSIFEPPVTMETRKRKTVNKSGRALRPAKKKATQHLPEKRVDEEDTSNEENIWIPSPPHLTQQTRTIREKKNFPGKTAKKRKAIRFLTDSSSDEENIETVSASPSETSRPSKTSRLTRRVSTADSLQSHSDRDTSATNRHRKSVKRKTELSVQPPSAGRFVTRRKRALNAKPKLPEAIIGLLSSSDEFTSECLYSGKVHRPSRKMPPAFVLSGTESLLNAAGTWGFVSNPLQELSSDELADSSLKLYPRKQVFCSTPSGAFSKPTSHSALPLKNQSSISAFSLSCISDLSTSQGVISPTQTEETQQNEADLHRRLRTSADSFADGKGSSSEHANMKNAVDSSSVCLLPVDSAGNSQFVSAAEGLEWLIEALKRKCLTERCTVQLDRSDCDALYKRCSQTTYSSCLEYSNSVCKEHTSEQARASPASFHLELSVSNLVTPCGASLRSDSSAEEWMQQSESELHGRSAHQGTDRSVEIIMDTHSPSSAALSTLLTPEEVTAGKNKNPNRRCSVLVEKLSPAQFKSAEQQTGGQDIIGFSEDNMDDSKDMRCSGESTERMAEKSKNVESPQTKAESTQSKTVENTIELKDLLKKMCLANRSTVEMTRLSRTHLKEILQIQGPSPKSITGSASDSSDHTLSRKIKMKSQTSATSEDNVTTEKEVEKHSGDAIPKRRKASLAPKDKKGRRSVSTDRSGTARKACVSGVSVSRWKNKASANKQVLMGRSALRGAATAADCSITELILKQHEQPQELSAATNNFLTPLRTSRLNLSPFLADLIPNTPTWSRLKAALSVHRKVVLTPNYSAPGSPVRLELGDVRQELFSVATRTPLSRHLQSQLRSLHSVPLCEDEDLSDAEKVCAECGQQTPLPWEECILPSRMKQCVKIGEGTFGEVFSTTNASGDTVALKIIPLEGSEKVNGEDQKTFGEILHEIIISKELSSLKEKQQNQTHGFIGLNDLHCVQGCYPPDFLNAWDTFNQRKGSENDRPDFFKTDQLFIILEFEFGGIDLENSNGTLSFIVVAKSILHQVTAALAVAEQELQFEHRDLHWGNVLVKTTKQKTGSFTLNGTTHCHETKGVLVRIIDYSLSRLEIDNLTVSCDISKDEELFMGQGDYQFEIYRLMRGANGNNWSSYHPHTNVLWLHYLCSKLLSMKYRSSGGRGAKDVRKQLTRFHGNVLQYGSATEVLQNCPMFQ